MAMAMVGEEKAMATLGRSEFVMVRANLNMR